METQNITATPEWVEACYRRGYIPQDARDTALARLNPHNAWLLWAHRLMAVTGASLILAAVLYFYAFNWAKLTPLMKLGSVELALVLCLAGAFWKGLANLSGRMLLTAAAFLVGVFLAVFGQIYQTGADAYQLFVAWAGLTLVWAVAGRFAPLWGLWLVVANLALALAYAQEYSAHWEEEMLLFTLLAGFNALFLAARVWLLQQGESWARAPWLFYGLLTVVVVNLAIPVCNAIFGYKLDGFEASAALIGVVGHIVLFMLYRYRQPDIGALGVVTLSATVIGLCWCFDLLPSNGALIFFNGFITLGVFAFVVRYLRRVAQSMEVYHG